MPSSSTMISLAPDLQVADHYGDWLAEYRAARLGIALVDRRYRGWVEIGGADRAGWLHNLVTNQVSNLPVGCGAYAFAVNVKGRVIFDLRYLIGTREIWLDIDRRRLEAAMVHLDHHLLAEDASIADRTDCHGRLGLCGPKLGTLLAAMGASTAAETPFMQHASIRVGGVEVRVFRSDFAGTFAVELVVPAGEYETVREELLRVGRTHELTPAGWRAVNALRMEEGLPWSVEDIDDQVIPPETGLAERGISYDKGCYLGQEIIERMRSRQALGRKLVGLRLGGGAVPAPDDKLFCEGRIQGRVTSVCDSPALGSGLALGYLNIQYARPGTQVEILHSGAGASARVIELPVKADSSAGV